MFFCVLHVCCTKYYLSNIYMLQRRKYCNSIWLGTIRVIHFIFILWHCGSSAWPWHSSSSDATSFSASFCFGWGCVNGSPFSEQSFSLSVRSWAVPLFSEYPLPSSVATPADKHLASHPNGHPPHSPQTHTHTHKGVHARACSTPPLPQGAQTTPAVFWPGRQKQPQSFLCQFPDRNQH